LVKDASQLPVSAHSPLRRIAGNMGRLLSGKAAAGIISLGSIAIAARILGVEQYGVLNLVHGFATLMGGTIAFSGFHGMVRYGAEALNRGAPTQFRNLVLLLALIELGMAAVAIGVAMLLVPWVGASLGWSPQAIQFGGLYCLAILATVRATPQGLLQLAERFDLIGLHPVIMPLVRLVGALAILFMDGGLAAFLWVWLAAAIAEGLSMWVLCWIGTRHLAIGADGRPTLKGTRRDNPGIVRFIATTNLDLTLRDIAPKATPLIIGWMLGPAAAGLYALVQRASAILIQPAQMLGEAAYPVVTRLLISGDNKAAGKVCSAFGDIRYRHCIAGRNYHVSIRRKSSGAAWRRKLCRRRVVAHFGPAWSGDDCRHADAVGGAHCARSPLDQCPRQFNQQCRHVTDTTAHDLVVRSERCWRAWYIAKPGPSKPIDLELVTNTRLAPSSGM